MKKAPLLIKNTKNETISLDVWYPEQSGNFPVVLFAHGFKGFKDWGHFNVLMEKMVAEQCVVVKFNFSRNGTTPEHMTDFVDLEKFGTNNWSIELADLNTVIDFVEENIKNFNGDSNKINLIGHSRGGGISILQTAKDLRIKKLITWASIASFDYFIDAIDLEKWKKEGVVYTFNGRTKQNMPLYYQLYEDYIQNKQALDISKKAALVKQAWLILHGSIDEAVSLEYAKQLHNSNSKSQLEIIENATHTFGGKHPFNETELPLHSKLLLEKTLYFIKNN